MAGNDSIFRLPPLVSPGAPIKAADINQIRKCLEVLMKEARAARLQSSVDISVTRNSGGTLARLKRGGGSSSGKGCTSLRPRLTATLTSGPDVVPPTFDWSIGVSPGYSESEIPELAGGVLTDDPPPALSISGPTTLWLKITWTPGAAEDESGWYISSGGEMVSAEFVLSADRPETTAPEVDNTSGSTTDGVFVIAWATVIADPDTTPTAYRLAVARCGNHRLQFCPPNSLSLIWDNPPPPEEEEIVEE